MTSVDTDIKAPAEVRKFPLTTLTAMVVGSMVGAGIFPCRVTSPWPPACTAP